MRVRVASAGTGKTTSLVHAFLAEIPAGVPLRRLAGVTFTRNAAAELRVRVGDALRELLHEGSYLGGLVTLDPADRPRYEEALRELDGATLTTIHGFMAWGLRLSAPLLGLDPDLSTLPEWEAQAVFEEELGGVLLVAADPRHPLHGAALRTGDRALPLAMELFRRRSLAEEPSAAPDDAAARDLVALYRAGYRRFAARAAGTLLAPAEIERAALRLVRTPRALARLAARAPHVVVDEFQDVNPLQGRFFAGLEAGGVQVQAVGDPKQSIYGFRNADVRVFRDALAQGEALPPLVQSRRQAQVPLRFLNRLTGELGRREWGFQADEAPPVTGAGAQAGVRGRVELHWVRGDAPLASLRACEAEVLAERLIAAHQERGVPYGEMAVLARGHHGLDTVRAALAARGVPTVRLKGRGYYARREIRDLVHALQVGVGADGGSLAAWLRGPFGGLAPGAIDAVLVAADAEARLRDAHPEVWQRLRRTRAAVRDTPLEALRTLVRAPMIDGRRYVDLLTHHERENVDALLFEVAGSPVPGVEVLLERLELLSHQGDAGEMPQAGEGVALTTVHGSKGLEWRLTAVYDLGAGRRPQDDRLYLDDGVVHLPGGPGFDAARAAAAERDAQESFRLLYVAVSRARDELLLTGSVTDHGPRGWAVALQAMGLGPGARQRERPDFALAVHAPGPVRDPAGAVARRAAPGLPEAPWTRTRYEPAPFPPVESPSRMRGAAGAVATGAPARQEPDAEPRAPHDPAEGERLPGQAVAVGTLLHDAIRRDARPDDRRETELLRAQEVMFPYTTEEQDRLLDEVRAMLEVYRSLLGSELPALDDRLRDLREWPVTLPDGRQVWQGVIDRLYRVQDGWFLDDYKTDRTLRPSRYAFQLAVYREAVRRVLGVDPVVRLVGLRDGTVRPYAAAELDAAWRARGAAGAREGAPG